MRLKSQQPKNRAANQTSLLLSRQGLVAFSQPREVMLVVGVGGIEGDARAIVALNSVDAFNTITVVKFFIACHSSIAAVQG